MSVWPFVRTPFTDVTGNFLQHQGDGNLCAVLEMRYVECLEAYGKDRGRNICLDIYRDFRECVLQHKQMNRVLAMQAERDRQYKAGERSKKDRYAETPDMDVY